MQTILSLLISFLLATATFASPIFPARPIRKDLKDLGHSVGKLLDVASPEESQPAASGWAAPSTWKGDKEWHSPSTGRMPAPSGHMPEKEKAPQWHATGAAVPTGSFERKMPMHTGVADKKMHFTLSTGAMPSGTGFPMKHNNASFPRARRASGNGFPHKVVEATDMPHKTLHVNSTSGIWPSGAVLPSGASWPSGAAWPSSMGTAFTLSTGAVPMATGSKPHFKVNATNAAFPTGTMPSKSIALETAPASDFHPKISASSFMAHAPAATGDIPKPDRKNPFVVRPSASAPVSDIEAPIAIATGVKDTPSSTHIHMPTAPAEAHIASSSAAPSAPAVTHSPETKAAVQKSPGSPCSPDEKSECHGESKYGHCAFNDGHWRWYWSDVEDGKYCKDGSVWSWSSGKSFGHSWS